MESTLKIMHYKISFFARMKHYFLLLIGIISIFGIITFINGDSENFFLLAGIISLIVSGYLAIKIYRTRYFITDLYSDSDKIFITYLLFSTEMKLESTLDKLNVQIRNTSSRSGFNCEIILSIENKTFCLNRDFDWGFADFKKIIDYLKFHKDLDLTPKEKFTLERLDERLKEIPF